jgi:DNA polymerase-1
VRVFAFDTETRLMSQGDMAPTVVCVSFATRARGALESGLIHHTQAEGWLRNLFENCLAAKVTMVGHNTSYDMACIQTTWPSLSDLIWKLYDAELVQDTIVRQKLSDLARGRYRGFRTDGGFFVPLTYDLDSVCHRHLGYRLDKDTWRLRYGELLGVPLEQWPAGALEYPVGDALATLGVWEAQEQDSQTYPEGPWFFLDQHAQTRAAWWLHLCSVHGILTSADAVERLKVAAQTEIDYLEEELVTAGLVRIEHKHHRKPSPWVERKATRCLDQVRTRVLWSCLEEGKLPRFSLTGKEVIAAAKKGEVSKSEKGRARSTDLTRYIAIDKDACLETGDPLLGAYIDYSSALKTLNADCEAYARGVTLPLHTRFESLAATGRTTSSGQTLKGADGVGVAVGTNIQNVRWNFPERCLDMGCRSRDIEGPKDHRTCKVCGGPAAYPPGIRECFVPRPGWLFANSDYDQGELHSLAQVCLKVLGHSRLAEVLNAGGDPHMIVAAEILHRPLDWCLEHKKDPEVFLARQTAKVANFGFPGGLGAEKLVLFARMAYHVTLTIQQAKDLKQTWFRAYPEMREYFKWVESLEQDDGTFAVQHLFTNRLRSKVFYCVACNSPFQGLLADAAKAAGYLIARACYHDRSSPLFGCRIVNFIHDEFMVEVPDDGPLYTRATAAANELDRLMVVGSNPFLPDCPLTTEALLAERWSKSAKRIERDGHLVPWRA